MVKWRLICSPQDDGPEKRVANNDQSLVPFSALLGPSQVLSNTSGYPSVPSVNQCDQYIALNLWVAMQSMPTCHILIGVPFEAPPAPCFSVVGVSRQLLAASEADIRR